MKDRVVRAVFAAAMVAGCGSAWADIPASAYVQDGLIAQWDGIENAGAGTHQAGATTWKNLKPVGLDFSLPSGCTVGDDSVTIPKNTKLTTSTSVFPSGTPNAHAGTYEYYWATPDVPTSASSYGATVLFISDMSFLYRLDKDQFQGTALMKDGKFYRHNFSYTATEQRAFHTVSYATLGTTTADNAFYLDGESRPGTVPGNGENMTQTARTGLVHHDTAGYLVIYKAARIYNRKLDEDEVKLNAAIDKVRFAGATEEGVGVRYDAKTQKLEVRVRVTYDANHGSVTADGEQVESGFSAWHEVGDTVTLVATPADGWRFVGWDGVCGGLDPKQGTLTVPLGFARNLTAKFAQEGVISSLAYVQDGLILQYDGIENAGVGTHDANARIWKDLSGSGNDAALTAMGAFGEKGLVLSIVKDVQYAATTKNTVKPGGSIEMFFRPTAGGDNTAGTMWAGYPTFTATPVSLGRIVINAKPVYFSFTSDTSGRWLNNVAYDTDYHVAYVNEGGSKMRAYANGVDTGVTSTSALAESKIAFGGFSDYERRMKGTIYAVRIYNRKLTEAEVIYNAAIDCMRFSAVPPDGYRWNERTEKVEVLVSVALKGAGGTVSFDGEGAVATQGEAAVKWVELGTTVTFAVVPTDGLPILKWAGGTPTQTGVNSYSVEGNSPIALTAFVGKRLCTWTGEAGDGLWTTAGNWSTEATPQEGEVVQLGTGTVTLTNSTPQLAAVEIASTLAMSNWTTKLNATDVSVLSGGIVKPSCYFQNDMMSNRVWIACKNITVASGGKINANALGYGWYTKSSSWTSAGQGPGAGGADGTGGGHGGRGGRGYGYSFGKTYDSVEAPIYAGSSAGASANGRGSKGGGAIRIEATGEVELHGPVTADGEQSGSASWGSGSGGSVYISCRTFRGDALISVLGGDSRTGNGGGGGGGRISITYDTEAQAAVSPKPTPTLQADCCRKGFDGIIPSENPNRKATTGKWNYLGDPGTVYLSDASFYPGAIWTECTGYFFVPGLDGATLEVDSVSLPDEATSDTTKGGHHPILRNLNLVVKGDISLGQRTKLCLSNCTVKAQNVSVATGAYFEMVDHGTVDVSGDFTLKGSGAATFWAGATNGVEATEWNSCGQEISIGGTLDLQDTSKVFPWCHQTLGGSPHFTLGALSVATDAKINGFGRGWGYVDGSMLGVYGKGPGSPKSQNGASYGGLGGGGSATLGKVYGNKKNPTEPGSDAGNSSNSSYVGGWGGSLFWADVMGAVTLDGTIAMNGSSTLGNEAGGGSGGGVNIRCDKLAGNGTITANGGCGGSGTGWSGNGGGGRIAIYCNQTNNWTGVVQAKAGANSYTYKFAATDGTVVWKLYKGLMLLVR